MVRHQFAVGRRAGLLALVAFTTACSDRSLPSGPSLSPGMVGRLLTCAADVRAQTLSCTAPGVSAGTGRLSADLVLGGQGIYVALRSSAVSYNAGTCAFQVLVDAASPQEHTVLRWSRQVGTGTYWAVWGATGNDVFAVGDDGSIWHYDGTSWTAQPSGTTQVLYGVWGSGRKDVFAVG